MWWSKISPAPSSVRVFKQGVRITPFISPWSTTDKIASTTVPLLRVIGGRSVIKSMDRFAKGQVVVGPGIGLNNGAHGFRLILNCWHMPHPLT